MKLAVGNFKTIETKSFHTHCGFKPPKPLLHSPHYRWIQEAAGRLHRRKISKVNLGSKTQITDQEIIQGSSKNTCSIPNLLCRPPVLATIRDHGSWTTGPAWNNHHYVLVLCLAFPTGLRGTGFSPDFFQINRIVFVQTLKTGVYNWFQSILTKL